MADTRAEKRLAPRITVELPTLVEVIGQREVELHPNLANVYERVRPATEMVGQRFPATLRDLSTNGAFIAGPALPLLSRVAFRFGLDGVGQVDVLGWTLWRRRDDCEIPRGEQSPVKLLAGFGVLFEAIPLEARAAIAEVVKTRGGC